MIKKSEPKSKGCHDKQADNYDVKIIEGLNDYLRENYFRILDRVAELSEPFKGCNILDIGIGTGLLSERLPEGFNLYGIDISERMMEKAKEKGIKVKLKKGDFCNIPYPDKYFDRIISTFAFHHITPEEKHSAFIEMDRVLSSDGLIVIGDLMIENKMQEAELKNKFLNEKRYDMLDELNDEYFTYIHEAIPDLRSIGFDLTYERCSTLSWIIKASRSKN